MRINSNGSMYGPTWSISSNGVATFSNIIITGGSIGFGGNSWTGSGLNFNSGGIAGGIGYGGPGSYGGTLGSTIGKIVGDLTVEGTLRVQGDARIEGMLYAAKAEIDSLKSKEISADRINVVLSNGAS